MGSVCSHPLIRTLHMCLGLVLFLSTLLMHCCVQYGGFSKFPGELPDLYHSYYGYTAFSLLEEPELSPLCPELGVKLCELELAGPELESLQRFSSLPPVAADELFGSDGSDVSSSNSSNKAVLTVDNQLSPAHTLLQIHCVDQKGLFYDILRTSKDCNVHIAYGRFSSKVKGYRNLELFVRGTDGKKIADAKHQANFCSRLKEEIVCPLRVIIVNRGPDSELLVANPVELSGKGRPRVFYDVTLALKSLGICIFSAEIGRHSTLDRQWEVYRFLLDESREFPLASLRARNQIVDRVTKTLMGKIESYELFVESSDTESQIVKCAMTWRMDDPS
ncbi:unnamed protein product [Microthlaspi erraticum]|uniref:ACT domain-containing protein ACR n=1 Tax=Microthlaspi erraticum TaxID=1685480 RepID=A0A6D2IKZ9_9BRAS|nr:unnamed protein product [Microthlaspi erraticum]